MGGVNNNQALTNTKGRNSRYIYFEGINNIEYWQVKKSNGKINRNSQVWYWCPKHNMEGEFDGMYTNNPYNKHDEWAEGKQSKIEA